MEWVIIAVSVIAIFVAFLKGRNIKKIAVHDEKMRAIAGYIKQGAVAYLKRQYLVMLAFVLVMGVVLLLVPSLGWQVAVCFAAGALLSAMAGYFGMRVAVVANVRTAQAAQKGVFAALNVAFSGGAVTGLLVVGFAALGLGGLYLIFRDISVLTGFSLGASSIALFCRVGGGIFTKAADVGADLVGKVEAGIPEDDPRNPAVIADNVGDNVGDVAGMGSDIFESYAGAVISSLLLGYVMHQDKGILFALLLAAGGIIASLLGMLTMRIFKTKNAHASMRLGTFVSAGLIILIAAGLDLWIFEGLKLFFAVLMGIVTGVAIGQITEYYTSAAYHPVKNIAHQSTTGAATNILSGMAVGMRSTAAPIVLIAAAVLVSFFTADLYGVALAALGMLSTVGMVVSVDAYGPIADNAGGIAQMSGQKAEVRKVTNHLDAVGNTTAAIGKGFSIASAALTAHLYAERFAAWHIGDDTAFPPEFRELDNGQRDVDGSDRGCGHRRRGDVRRARQRLGHSAGYAAHRRDIELAEPAARRFVLPVYRAGCDHCGRGVHQQHRKKEQVTTFGGAGLAPPLFCGGFRNS